MPLPTLIGLREHQRAILLRELVLYGRFHRHPVNRALHVVRDSGSSARASKALRHLFFALCSIIEYLNPFSPSLPFTLQAFVPLEWLSALLLLRYAPGGSTLPATLTCLAVAYYFFLDPAVGLAWAPMQVGRFGSPYCGAAEVAMGATLVS